MDAPLAYFYPTGHEAHFERGHPERPERVEALRGALQKAGWWDIYPQLPPEDLSEEQLRYAHSQHYLQTLNAACREGKHLDADTYTTPASWQLARQAAGGAVAVARAVWQRQALTGFALTRPPGHHATRQAGMGFCLLNNIAIATQALLREEEAKRLAIVDLDLHHGNGTQDIFWEQGEVLYISTHQSPLYPGTGRLEETGAGEGAGTTANFPLPPGSGDQAFSTVMAELVLPLLDQFSPEMLLVSVGFDTHWLDPLGSLLLSADMYGELVSWLGEWARHQCQGRIALFLEGGYDLDAGAATGLACVAALTGQKFTDPLGPSPIPESNAWRDTVRQAKQIHGG